MKYDKQFIRKLISKSIKWEMERLWENDPGQYGTYDPNPYCVERPSTSGEWNYPCDDTQLRNDAVRNLKEEINYDTIHEQIEDFDEWEKDELWNDGLLIEMLKGLN